MTPETFHALLEEETRNAPASPATDLDLAAGRRRLRRRRLAATTAGLVIIAGVGGTAAALAGADPSPRPDHVADSPAPAESILETCRAGKQIANDPGAAVFGQPGGDPVVKSSTTDPSLLAALEAPGGRYWAECVVAGGKTFVISFDPQTARRPPQPTTVVGPGCPLVDGSVDPGCRTFRLSVVTRLPDAVAAVRFTTWHGETFDAPSLDGYVVVSRIIQIPDGQTFDEFGTPQKGQPVEVVSMTYLDASGTTIAGAPGTPGLGTYRVLGGWPHTV
jgi:hypothetical protein